MDETTSSMAEDRVADDEAKITECDATPSTENVEEAIQQAVESVEEPNGTSANVEEVDKIPENVTDTNKPPETKSKFKYGIVYLSYIPDGLNVSSIREIMSHFGEVGRIYMEPDENNLTSKRLKFTEGWVEFKKKRIAKDVAHTLNGTILQYGKKHSRVSGQIWSIKYLHRFKWAHLKEQLRHDKAVKDQKRRFEMSQTKKQVDFYQRMTERSKYLKKRRSQSANESDSPNSKESTRAKTLQTRQNKPIGQGSELLVPVGEDLLSSIFKKVT